MNVYTPSRFDERVVHLAVGVEPTSAISGQRLTDVDVRWERFPRPVDRWRRWPPGSTLTAALPRLDRHRSGRFALRYDQDPLPAMDLRVVDDDRRIVPRRVRLTIADEQIVLDAEADPTQPPHPAWRRIFPLACFPGAAADLPSGASVLRGQVVRATAPNVTVPVRWPRIRARTSGGAEIGWAHGDDRGEFVLVVGPSDDVAIPTDPLLVVLTVGALLPPPAPDPLDPARALVDPLWDLLREPVTASATPQVEATINGRRFLTQHTQFAPISPAGPILVPHGRQTSVVVRIA